jgi:hypothetical protein
MSSTRLFEVHDELCSKAKKIMVAKNHDYRSGTDDPYANFRGSVALGINPITGILLRMQDKLCRIATFAEKGTLLVKGEGVEDAIKDVINYAVLIGGMIDAENKLVESAQVVEGRAEVEPKAFGVIWSNP